MVHLEAEYKAPECAETGDVRRDLQISRNVGTATLARDSQGRSCLLVACHAWFYEEIGGSFKIATELSEHLASEGHRVFYVCGTKESVKPNPTVEGGVELWRYPFPKAHSPHPANVLAHVMGAYRLTRQILRRWPISCLNGHTPLQFLGASLAMCRRDARQVYSVHSPFGEELRCGWDDSPRGLKKRIAVHAAKWIERWNCRRASVVQCHSQFTAECLAREYGRDVSEKTVVAPGWVGTERFRPINDREGARAVLGAQWRTRNPVFFTVRRLETRMGLEQLIEAAEILSREGFRFRVLIGGAGQLESRLRQKVLEAELQDTVCLLGRISEAELPRCFAAADCFVLPTRALECFGLIVLEAFACGTPVIGSPVGAIPELAGLQGKEWLTTGTTSQEIAHRMAAFLRGELTADRGRLRTIAEQFSAEGGFQRLSQVLVPNGPA